MIRKKLEKSVSQKSLKPCSNIDFFCVSLYLLCDALWFKYLKKPQRARRRYKVTQSDTFETPSFYMSSLLLFVP